VKPCPDIVELIFSLLKGFLVQAMPFVGCWRLAHVDGVIAQVNKAAQYAGLHLSRTEQIRRICHDPITVSVRAMRGFAQCTKTL
jgi:hypothetical protein